MDQTQILLMNTNKQPGHASDLPNRVLALVPIRVHWAFVVMSPAAQQWFQKIQSIRANLHTSAAKKYVSSILVFQPLIAALPLYVLSDLCDPKTMPKI